MTSPAAARETIITDISISGYLWSKTSLFRRYQNKFLETYGRELTGHVIELGGEKPYDHARFFPNASSFTCTNVARDYDEFLDVTNMAYADHSQDAYVCISVMEIG